MWQESRIFFRTCQISGAFRLQSVCKMCVVVPLCGPRLRPSHANLGKGHPLRVPRCIPSGHGADQALSLPAPANVRRLIALEERASVPLPKTPPRGHRSPMDRARGGASKLPLDPHGDRFALNPDQGRVPPMDPASGAFGPLNPRPGCFGSGLDQRAFWPSGHLISWHRSVIHSRDKTSAQYGASWCKKV